MGMYRLAATILALATLTGAAHADELADFHAAVEAVAAHNRVALGYLRTENGDLAALELEGLRAAWGKLVARFGKTPPAVLRDNKLFVTALVDVPVRVVTAAMMIDTGRLEVARDSLAAIRQELSAMRRASHIEVLADCVLDANGAMDALFAYGERPPDGTKGLDSAVAAATAAAADAYAVTLKRCDAMASPALRQQGEFRRLFDGAYASLALVPRALTTRDDDLLHRLLIELRSFDNLIAFRFG